MSKSADRRLLDRYREQERINTVTRSCMCCRESFSTDQAYRLCPRCRTDEVAMQPIPTIEDLLEAA